LGLNTALVIDMGYEETTLIPICEGTPMLHAWQAQPFAAKAIHEYVISSTTKASYFYSFLLNLFIEKSFFNVSGI